MSIFRSANRSGEHGRDTGHLVVFTRHQRSGGAEHAQSHLEPLLSRARPSVRVWTVQVPLDHDGPGGAAISIALVRLAAIGPGARIGSLFFNPGGPGGSGVDFLLGIAPIIPAPLRAQFDLVGFDPRGIARSTAVRCFGNASQWAGLFLLRSHFPSPAAEEALWAAADHTSSARATNARPASSITWRLLTSRAIWTCCARRWATIFSLYVGYSYGSYLALLTQTSSPDRFRALVVDGVLDPVAWSTGAPGQGSTLPFSTRLRSDAGAAATLDEFFRLCDAGDSNCAFAGDAAARFAALSARLRAAPHVIVNPVTGQAVPFSYADLIAIALGAMYDSFSWSSFARFLAFIEAQAEPAVIGAQLKALHEELGLITKRGVPRYRNGPEGVRASPARTATIPTRTRRGRQRRRHPRPSSGTLVVSGPGSPARV